MRSDSELPRIIWILWLQGWEAAPPLVRACRDSWVDCNPRWEVRALDAKAIHSLLPELAEQGTLTAAAYSDRVRLRLLSRHGGVWVDATTYCHRPLDDWLPARMNSGFFAFSAPAPGRKLSTWFLASTPGSLIISRWDAAADEYWAGRTSPHAYYWVHQLFGELCRRDPEFRQDWRRTPSLPADGPHYFVPYRGRLTNPLTKRVQARLASGRDPVYKLTHRTSEKIPPGSAYAYFVAGGWPLGTADDRVAALDRSLEALRWTLRDMRKVLGSGVRAARSSASAVVKNRADQTPRP